jgi:hypothetical protein
LRYVRKFMGEDVRSIPVRGIEQDSIPVDSRRNSPMIAQKPGRASIALHPDFPADRPHRIRWKYRNPAEFPCRTD